MKILLFINKTECPDRCVSFPTNYDNIVDEYLKKGANTGNKLWQAAIENYLVNDEIEYDFYDNQDVNIINSNYSLVLFPCANRLRADRDAINDLICWKDLFNQIKIPVYVVGLGAQAPDFSCLKVLVKAIGKYAFEFAKSILNTGGKIAVRGYFTKKFFDLIGINNVEVLGCPSMYSAGRELKIVKKNVERDNFSFVVPAKPEDLNYSLYWKNLKKYKKSFFIDQNIFTPLLYGKIDQNMILNSYKNYGSRGVSLFLDGRVRLYYDIIEWHRFLVNGCFDFSFGTRIHGNFISILSGIPSAINATDSRTRELAEFFQIPIIKSKKYCDVFDLYKNLDYSSFNNSFPQKYDRFADFLISNKIIKDLKSSVNFLNFLTNLNYEDVNNRIEANRLDFIKLNNSTHHLKNRMIDLLKKIRFSHFISKYLWKKNAKKISKLSN